MVSIASGTSGIASMGTDTLARSSGTDTHTRVYGSGRRTTRPHWASTESWWRSASAA